MGDTKSIESLDAVVNFYDEVYDPTDAADIAKAPDEALILLASAGNTLADAELRRRGK